MSKMGIKTTLTGCEDVMRRDGIYKSAQLLEGVNPVTPIPFLCAELTRHGSEPHPQVPVLVVHPHAHPHTITLWLKKLRPAWVLSLGQGHIYEVGSKAKFWTCSIPNLKPALSL